MTDKLVPKELTQLDIQAALDNLPGEQQSAIREQASRLESGVKRIHEERSTGPAKVQFGPVQAYEVIAKLGIFLQDKEYRP